jgi:hypothetical protein
MLEGQTKHAHHGGRSWLAAAWLALWVPAYAAHWGWPNFIQLCDLAVFIGCAGLARRHRLLMSSQALSTIIVGVIWTVDVIARSITGRPIIGGTEYMWDQQVPLWVRLLSLFHVALPLALLLGLRREGYDRRALPLQAAITAAALVVSRLLGDGSGKNLNYAFADPIFGRQWGPPAVHLVVIFVGSIGLVYLPTHLALDRWLGSRGTPRPGVGAASM